MNTILVIAVMIAVVMAVSITYSVSVVISKGQRADQASIEAEQARYDLARAERDLAMAKGQTYLTPEDMRSMTLPDPDGKIALWKAQNGY